MNVEHSFDRSLPQRLAERLKQKLPGPDAQAAFAPALGYGRHFGPPPHHARAAAVVCALTAGPNGGWRIPLTVRNASLRTHGGQVSFPGGAVDPGETLEEAARREWCEELGESEESLSLLGELTPLYVFNSNFQVTPFVAIAQPFHPTPNPHEVAELIYLELDDLFCPTRRDRLRISRPPLSFHAPSLRCGPHQVWGATSMILSELSATLAGLCA